MKTEMNGQPELRRKANSDRKGQVQRRRIRELVQTKLERLARSSEKARFLDLFSGCGGLALGFARAGGISVGGVELDPIAAESYARNLHAGIGPDELKIHSISRDITSPENSPDKLLKVWGHEKPGTAVDVIVGGPPCPAFTRVGRAKLREIHEDPEAFKNDPRAQLYIPYLRYVEALAPVALLMENVPDILNFGGHNLGEEIADSLEALGYVAAYTLLNSANYGVPQMRERFFLVAIHEAAGVAPSFPLGTHYVAFPPGYKGARSVALKHVEIGDLLGGRSRFQPTPALLPAPRPAVTAMDAMHDLPPITAHLDGLDRRGARRFDTPVEYRSGVRLSPYAQSMRNWPAFESKGYVKDHVTRSLSNRDYRLFRLMKSGDDYPKAHALAESLFKRALRGLGGHADLTEGSDAWLARRAEYVPPYDPSKFPNKWRKMEPDLPARTLMAHLGKDSYSHIHYDSAQARVISVREAARLQSFPDGFAFSGTMNPAFRQIGNSVPPLMSFAIASHLFELLNLERQGLKVAAGA